MNAAERAEIRKQLEACFSPDGYSFNVELGLWASDNGNSLLDALDAAEARIAELKEALRDAINEYEGAVRYKKFYFTKNHEDAEEIARLRAVLDGKVAE